MRMRNPTWAKLMITIQEKSRLCAWQMKVLRYQSILLTQAKFKEADPKHLYLWFAEPLNS